MQDISSRIKEVRVSNKMTQTKFGNELSVTASYISRLESGREKPTDMLLKLIALRFNVATDWLFFGKGNKSYMSKASYDFYDRTSADNFHKGVLQNLDDIKLYFSEYKNSSVDLHMNAILMELKSLLEIYNDNPAYEAVVFENLANIIIEMCDMIKRISLLDRLSDDYTISLFKFLRNGSASISELIMKYEDLFSKNNFA